MEDHCKALQADAIKDLNDKSDSGLAIEVELPSLAIAFECSR